VIPFGQGSGEGATGSLRWYIPSMIQSLELIADENGGLHLPSDLVLPPGTRAILVVELDASRPQPGWAKGWIRKVSDDFDVPLEEGFWTGTNAA